MRRLGDLAGAAAGLLVFAPFMAVIIVAVWLDDGGPILFRHCAPPLDSRTDAASTVGRRRSDELIKQFKKNELQPVVDNNIYHSPEESVTDSENDGKKIVVNDLRWRSSTVSNLFFIFMLIVILICTNYS